MSLFFSVMKMRRREIEEKKKMREEKRKQKNSDTDLIKWNQLIPVRIERVI